MSWREYINVVIICSVICGLFPYINIDKKIVQSQRRTQEWTLHLFKQYDVIMRERLAESDESPVNFRIIWTKSDEVF